VLIIRCPCWSRGPLVAIAVVAAAAPGCGRIDYRIAEEAGSGEDASRDGGSPPGPDAADRDGALDDGALDASELDASELDGGSLDLDGGPLDGGPLDGGPLDAAIPRSPPIVAYSFSEGSGTVAANSAGSAVDLALTGPAWTVTGRYGSALDFDGVDDQGRAPFAPVLEVTHFTLEAWVRPSRTIPGYAIAVGRQSAEGYSLYWLGLEDHGVSGWMKYGRAAALGYGVSGPMDAIPVGTWSHIATTWDGTSLSIYLDGTLIDALTIRQTLLASPSGDLYVGGRGAAGELFAGTIDEIRIYDYARTAAEIALDMATPIP
jgi:hypothetical protein